MLGAVIGWSLGHRWVVLACVGALVVAGTLALRALKIDAFPDTTPVQVQVNTIAPSLAPEEIERQITFPIELVMSGLPGLESLRSLSQVGLSSVVLTFREGTNIYFARQLVNERLGTVELPPGIDRPELGVVATGLGEVFHYVLIPEGKDLTEARTLQDWVIKPALRSVPGTAEVNSWGGLKKQYQVRVDPSLLIKYGLTLDQIVAAVPANNFNIGGGYLNQSGDMLVVQGVARTTDVKQIEDIVITAKDGVPVKIRDVAQVAIDHELRRGMVSANGKGEVVLGLGFMLMGENSYTVTRQLREKFLEIKATLPKGIRAEVVYDRTVLVDQVISTVKNNLFDGAYLVVIILFLLLGNLRVGLVAASVIPLAMLFGFCGMWQLGIAGSLLSLGAIDFGIVVDSSVVVLESVIRRLAHHGPVSGQRRLDLIRQAAIDVRIPTVFGQIIIMIVYLPILTLEGVEGKLFRPMAMTVMCVLAGSLIMSLTLTPVLASFVLPKHVVEHEVLIVRLARAIYKPLLQLALRASKPVVIAAIAVLAGAGYLGWGLGTEFVPRLSEGDVVMGVVRAQGTSLEESVYVNSQMEKALLAAFPDEIGHVWSRVGSPEVATEAGNLEATDMFISLKPRSEWKRANRQMDLVKLMLAEVEQIPGQIIWFTQPIEQRINETVSGVRADVALKLFADDFDQLISKSRELEEVLQGIQGAADVTTEQIAGQPILRIRVNQDQLARYGIPARLVMDLVESVGGKSLGEVVEGQLRFPLVVRLPEHLRNDMARIGDLMVAGPAGEQIPLSRLADVERISGPKLISREWGRRRITVQCNVRDRDTGSFVAEAREKIAQTVDLPADKFRVEWGGQFENMQRAQRRLMIVVPVALLMIVAILFLIYRNLTDTLLVFACVPFGCVGGIIALELRHMPLSVAAAVGFITLSGVSVLNSMVVVSLLREKLAEGMERRAAIEHAALTSLRTVLMTSLVASVGFIPMAASSSAGAEVQQPLATVVIGGVLSSALMTLLVLPVLYAVVGQRKAPASAP
jgi:cobalt-zinc-cadmium resistance protein CzcA